MPTNPATPRGPRARRAPREVGPILRALADDNRLRILGKLRSGEQCVCTLTNSLDCAQSLLSHHLKTLKAAGLVTDRREGRWAYYAINPDAISFIERFLASLRGPAGPRPVARRCADPS